MAQLAEHASLRGQLVEIHAGDAYVAALRTPLEAVGAIVDDPVRAGSLGETLAWYDQRPANPRLTRVERSKPTITADDVDEVVAALGDRANARTVPELLASHRDLLASPGMYSCWVDDPGASDLSAGLGHEVRAGLIYAGQAGATRWPSGQQSTNTLWGRLVGMHLGANARFSTFRLTLASILQPGAAEALDEVRLTEWMTAHLSVVVCPIPDGDRVDDIETEVVARLDPPLNLAKRPRTPLRHALSQLRKQVGIR